MADNKNDNFFQISVKGLVINEKKEVLMTLDEEGCWDPIGGRVQKGENMIQALVRECKEETGLDCEILDERPIIVYASIDKEGRGRAMVYYSVRLSHMNFTPSDECLEMKFFSKEGLKKLNIAIQTVPLIEYL